METLHSDPPLIEIEGFDRFVGIDWSGSEAYARADGEYPIQVADLRMTDQVMDLVVPEEQHNPRWQQNRWSRTTVKNWLIREINQWPDNAKPMLIGLDFAFSFPFADCGCFFPREVSSTQRWQELIGLMREHTDVNDYSTSSFVNHEMYQKYFKTVDHEGEHYEPRFRVTENRGYLRGHVPATVFKLIGGDQVGKGSISGMAVLSDIRREIGSKVHFWPFDGITPSNTARAVVVEIWPKLLYELLGVPPVSHRYPKVFRLALKESNIPTPDRAPGAAGENSGDAIISAAALHYFATDANLWLAPQVHGHDSYHREGWIWGADGRL